MKHVFQTITLFATLCAALPSSQHRDVVTLSPGSRSSLGAAYFMSNDPRGNYLFAASIEHDAKLVLRTAYSTGGTGAHATSKVTSDALFSQGSIIKSYVNNVIILVNAGSNTLSVFRIDPENPSRLAMIGQPVPSGGDFPSSVALNGAEDVVCALNGGKINNVNCFSLDGLTGLSPLSNTKRSLGLKQTTPPSGPAFTGGQLIFSPDHKQLILTVKGPFPTGPGYLAIWDLENKGSLSQKYKKMEGGAATWSATFIKGKDAILSADPVGGYNIFDLSAFAANFSVKGKSFKVEGEEAICWSDYSPKTGNYYLSDSTLSVIYEVQVDERLNGRVVASHAAEKYSVPLEISIASLPGQPDHLYMLASNQTSIIEVFTLNGAGQAKSIQKLDIKCPVEQAGIPFSSENVYGLATWLKNH
ncbi:hypothetical protein AX17_003206 [Amanita inopinata Kibby_2008]|nr:hypothetical protein AX17_003206 [Amanita inopinata Kibby_2008]